ncbi:MAG: aldolase [Candidatus Lumbricidophila eiseniae]|uniref:Aldolase n=1 Tax=Candidatus Lumbricidiphila eiseniae TaxID=1969409 RepID=A0A2A6FSN2_9MICO|nr:MAG: aldolase [Candidatus Lumbricidophila eiseniae]
MTHTDRQPRGLDEIVRISRAVGHPKNDLVVLAEGNTSLKTSEGRMLVKATGANLRTVTAEDFVEVDLDVLLELIRSDRVGDDEVAIACAAGVTWGTKRPSVEALLHAVCHTCAGVTAVIHTHSTPVNALLCSDQAELLTRGSLFPDQIVVLGRHTLLIPYIDPGLPLARFVLARLLEHTAEHGSPPRVVYLQNHGVFALGASTDDAMQVTTMAAKSARVLLGALSVGRPTFLEPTNAERIDTRPDELLRRSILLEGQV